MITDSEALIDAPAHIVWDVYSDVERWPDWTSSVERIVPLDGAELEVGRRFEIKQPHLPKLIWEVTALEPGRSWTWRQWSPGNTALGTHDVIPRGDDATLVHQRLEQRGPVGVLVGIMGRRTTRRYLALEAQGLKTHSETRHRGS